MVNIISWTSLFLQTFQADFNISFGVVWSSAGTGNVLTLLNFQFDGLNKETLNVLGPFGPGTDLKIRF